jgi:glycosidase
MAGETRQPDWARGITWYQIIPERFRNGDPSNDPTFEKVMQEDNTAGTAMDGWSITPWTSNFYDRSEFEKKYSSTFRGSVFRRRYGGDIQGIIDKLDYLVDLGIEGLYLCPVFEAVSLHKYDASSYHHVDINFGPDPEGDKQLMLGEDPADPGTWTFTAADKLFLQLVKLVHERGMHIIIDGVFNHTGVHFWAFQDIVKNGKKSRFVDWYMIRTWSGPKFTYDSWWGIDSLPVLNRDERDMHPAPKKYVFDITARWMDPDGDGDPSDGIDGWRLDVPRDLPIGFWKSWSAHVKEINPNAYLAGELWEISPDYVSKAGPFDSLMDYDFARALSDFIVARKTKIKASQFVSALQVIQKAYPDNSEYLMNLLDSHDVERVASLITNPDRKFNTDCDERNPKYNPGKPQPEAYGRVRQLVAFQMMYQGSPLVFYGDEVGMWGAHDPFCRKPMLWDDMCFDDEIIDSSSGFASGYGKFAVAVDNDMLEFYKKIIQIRKRHPAIIHGSTRFVQVDDTSATVAFSRAAGRNEAIACFNAGQQSSTCRIKIEPVKRVKDAWTGKGIPARKGLVELEVPVDGFRIITLERKEE